MNRFVLFRFAFVLPQPCCSPHTPHLPKPNMYFVYGRHNAVDDMQKNLRNWDRTKIKFKKKFRISD